MIRGPSRSRNFFKRLVVNGVSNSKAAIQNDCLIKLYDADSELKAISSELDSFDGKKDPIRCNLLVNQLRTAQDKVISLLFQLMDDCNCERASRDYRMKFPDEILLSEGSESLNGQIWFGAECLSAGSNILNHTKESTMLRPMAKTLTQHLDLLRNDLRDLVVDGGGAARINQQLIRKMVAFDHIFATFEYEYVRTMLPIRTVAEIEKLQEVAVLFSETLIDCVKRGLIKQDDIDEFQPIVMIAIPRLAIVRGLLYKNENPIYTRHKSHMCSLFQPFHGPLHSIRKLLRGLSQHDLFILERMLANDQSINDSLDAPHSDVSHSTENQHCHEPTATQRAGCPAVDQDDVGQASTSNTYTNVLMDGLQYPVGQKRHSLDDGDSNDQPTCTLNIDQKMAEGEEIGYSRAQASSSDVILNDDFKDRELHKSRQIDHSESQTPPHYPAGSSTASPSSSVSPVRGESHVASNKFRAGNASDNLYLNECDNDDYCLSPPESDVQLEKLIANFSPSVNDDEPGDCDQSIQVAPILGSVNQNPTSTCLDTANSSADCLIEHTNESLPRESLPKSSSDRIDSDNCRQNSEDYPKSDSIRSNMRSKKGEEAKIDDLIQKQTQQYLHRLFVAISGVADQLQSNFASDLRFILRHIFSSEIDGDQADTDVDNVDVPYDEDDDEEDDCSNQDNSDSSLPIEQGIEAREANLIDFDSSYTVMDNIYHSGSTGAVQNDQNPTNYEYANPSGASVAVSSTPMHSITSNSAATDQAAFQARLTQEQDLADEMILAELMRASAEQNNGMLYDSPNDPSIMDNNQQQQRVMQHHIHSISARASARAAAAAAVAAQQAYDQVLVNNGQIERVRESSQRHSDRRSRHHHHHGHHSSSRSSRRNRGPPPVWVPDQLVVQCFCCQAPFTLFRRRHHCRACGQIFCSDCSKFTKNLNCWGYNGPVRVCEACFNQP